MTALKIPAVINVFENVLGGPAVLHEPHFSGNEWTYVKECIDTGWVSTAGAYVERFEDMLCHVTGVKHAIATVNGTAALHVAMILAGVKPGDEVIVPSLTFVATANAVVMAGAIPHFADAEIETLGIDATKLRAHLQAVSKSHDGIPHNIATGCRIAAVVCMHTFGHPVDLDAVAKVCREFDIPLIEDATESLGSYYKGRHTGNHGLLAALSFNGNKTVTSGGGGAILTNDDHLGKQAKHLTTTARVSHDFESIHDSVGFNYRLPNINAALGCAQLEALTEAIEKKRRLAEMYRTAFAPIAGIKFFTEPVFAVSNYWLNLLLLDAADVAVRDEILSKTNAEGFMTRAVWRPMHLLDMYTSCPRMDLPVVDDIYARSINIPSSPQLANA